MMAASLMTKTERLSMETEDKFLAHRNGDSKSTVRASIQALLSLSVQ